MQLTPFLKASIFALAIATVFVACLEYYWRSRGFLPSYNDDKVLWAKQRKKIYKSMDQTTVFIGGSRIKFDLDLPTWKKSTGEEAIQLAIVGTPARLILRDLADDEKFKGKLIIDVAESQFFSIDTLRRDKSAREAIEYYKKETPAQKTSAAIDYLLESQFVFLKEGKFGLNALLNDLQIPNRPGVSPPLVLPKEFGVTGFNRQTSMSPMFLADPNLQKRQKDIMIRVMIAVMNTPPFLKGDTLESLLQGIKTSIDKIRSRGGLVMFVRPPSSGDLLENEKRVFPRREYWDHLLEYTNTPGIHFSDYPGIANFICPEWSHLAPKDGVTFTRYLAEILRDEKGWMFPNKTKADIHDFKQ